MRWLTSSVDSLIDEFKAGWTLSSWGLAGGGRHRDHGLERCLLLLDPSLPLSLSCFLAALS